MALAFTQDDIQVEGNRRVRRGTVTFDSSYPTGGEPFTAADLGLSTLTDFTVELAPATGYQCVWDRSVASPKLMAFYGDNNNAADGPFIEVPNATNLATLIARYVARGV